MKHFLIGSSFVIVFVIVFLLSKPTSDSSNSPNVQAATSSSRGANGALGGGTRAPEVNFNGLTAAEYQAAWDSVPSMKLGKSQRILLQQRILAGWAAVDLKAAAGAAFGEAWDMQYGPFGQTLENHLAIAFAEVFRNQPDEIFDRIKADEFGILESAVMRSAWVEALAKYHPKMLLPYLAELDPKNQRAAVSALNRIPGKEALEQLWASLKGHEDLRSSIGELLAYRTSTEFSREEILALIKDGGTSGRLATTALAEQIASEPVTVSSLEVADSLPEESRNSFIHALMKHDSADPEFARQGIERLVAADAWNLIADKEISEKVRLFAAETPPVELAAWAVSLPQREEAARLFHRGVEPFIVSDPDSAWEWISGFEEGMWRDRAYAEFSQQALHHFNDPQKSDEALNKITDPAFQKEARSWRRGWENQTGFRSKE